MTVEQLITEYNTKNTNDYLFDKKYIKAYGAKISEMKISGNTIIIKDLSEKEHECYELTMICHKLPSKFKKRRFYFDINTFEEVHPC